MNEIAFIQGAFYVATGLWPLVSLQSFIAVTGPKTDIWLLKTVAVLILVAGLVLCIGAFERQSQVAVFALGIFSATALATIDIYYSIQGTIRKVYLFDAIVEAAFIGAWIWYIGRVSIEYFGM